MHTSLNDASSRLCSGDHPYRNGGCNDTLPLCISPQRSYVQHASGIRQLQLLQHQQSHLLHS